MFQQTVFLTFSISLCNLTQHFVSDFIIYIATTITKINTIIIAIAL